MGVGVLRYIGVNERDIARRLWLADRPANEHQHDNHEAQEAHRRSANISLVPRICQKVTPDLIACV